METVARFCSIVCVSVLLGAAPITAFSAPSSPDQLEKRVQDMERSLKKMHDLETGRNRQSFPDGLGAATVKRITQLEQDIKKKDQQLARLEDRVKKLESEQRKR